MPDDTTADDEDAPQQRAFHDDDHVLISPRYLAGGTTHACARYVLGPLVQRFAWRVDPERRTVTSPDGRSVITFDPSRRDGPWWQVTHQGPQRPGWSAEFGNRTPAEAVAGVTWRLPQLGGDDTYSKMIGELGDIPSVSRLTTVYRWRPTENGWTSPDEHCSLDHDADAETAWQFTHSIDGQDDTRWTASFSRHTPVPIVASFLEQLATGLPVERPFGMIRRAALDHAVIEPSNVTGCLDVLTGYPVNPLLHAPALRNRPATTADARSPGPCFSVTGILRPLRTAADPFSQTAPARTRKAGPSCPTTPPTTPRR